MMAHQHIDAVVKIRTPPVTPRNQEHLSPSFTRSTSFRKQFKPTILKKYGQSDSVSFQMQLLKDGEDSDYNLPPKLFKPILKRSCPLESTAIQMQPLQNGENVYGRDSDRIRTISETCEDALSEVFKKRYMRDKYDEFISGRNQCKKIRYIDWKINKEELEDIDENTTSTSVATNLDGAEHCYSSEVDARYQLGDGGNVSGYPWRFPKIGNSRHTDWRWSSRRRNKREPTTSESHTNEEDHWSGESEEDDNTCSWLRWPDLVIDPSTPFHYKWLLLVTVAILYNIIFIIARSVFWQLNNISIPYVWLILDYSSDIIYVLDTIFHAHEGYLDQGIMVRNPRRLRRHYVTASTWKTDILSSLPTDLVYLVWPPRKCDYKHLPCPVAVRANRLFRLKRMMEFFEKTETRTGCPNVFRICKVVFSILVLIHWNSCIYFGISYIIGFGHDNWVYNLSGPENGTLLRQYMYCFYWSTLTLTTIGETPPPESDMEYFFVVADFLAGVLIFATIVGNIGSMITNMNVARVEFQNRMDRVKQYMTFRQVSKELEIRVIRWFAYTWENKQALDEERVLSVLPDKLKAEIAIHVHLDTLKKVRIFQDCEPGLLEELVLKLRLQVFSPGDYICRKGDVGREMYIVKRGCLSVVADDKQTQLATLTAGSVFGEVSVLDIPGNRTGNRRTANVRSIGYSDLFCLGKTDLLETLVNYPGAKQSLMERGCQLLRKDNLLDENVFQNAARDKGNIADRVDNIDKVIEGFQQKLQNMMEEHMHQQNTLIERINKLEKKRQFTTDSMNEETTQLRRRKYISSSATSVHTDYEPAPGGSCDNENAAGQRYANFGRRSFHVTPKSTWTRRRHKPSNVI